MKFLLLLILSFSSAVYSGKKCMTPKPMDHFSLKRFSGLWYHGAYDTLDPISTKLYENARCADMYFHLDIGRHEKEKWRVDYVVNVTEDELIGSYYLPKPREGLLKLFYPAGNYTNDFTVLCTDYRTYLAAYSCAQITPDQTSEFIFLFLRNMTMYEQVISIPRVQRCYKSVMSKSVSKLRKSPFYNCPDDFY